MVRALALLESSVVTLLCVSELMVGKSAGFFGSKRKDMILDTTDQMTAMSCQSRGFHNCHNRQ